jgi:basic amino acid/polyamine antiporter, APA family
MMGLGSILGTGIFVSLGIAAGVAGPSVVLAIVIAAFVAACNGLSSAQLAANHPVSGGTYEYGYRWLHPSLGFTAGWMFLCAKTASAATAALGFSGYVMSALGQVNSNATIALAAGTVAGMTTLVLSGIRRSNSVNILIVSFTLLSLLLYVVAGFPSAVRAGSVNLKGLVSPANPVWLSGLLEASALMFVAYTGYGRIATLGEEIQQPRRNIPRAIVLTLVVSMALYVAVGLVAIGAAGTESLADASRRGAAPLEITARQFGGSLVALGVSVGAITAMLGVLLNLILGLSRVVLAMARRRDLPAWLAGIDRSGTTPIAAVVAVGAVIMMLTLIGSVKTTWSFSAFTVLVYYALTNLATIRLSDHERMYPRIFAWLGLIACLFLAFRVQPAIWATGLGMIGVGLCWQRIAHRLFRVENTRNS